MCDDLHEPLHITTNPSVAGSSERPIYETAAILVGRAYGEHPSYTAGELFFEASDL